LAARSPRKLSKRQSRQLWTYVLITAAVVSVVVAFQSFRLGMPGRGFDYLGWAIGCIGVVIAFTLPTQCRVITSRGGECRNRSYGVLFGCSGAAGHRFGKFFARVGLRRQPPSSHAAARQRAATGRQWAATDALPIVVTVAGGGMGICAFWFGLISTATGVASVALAAAQLH
jgi:hypothetical protein